MSLKTTEIVSNKSSRFVQNAMAEFCCSPRSDGEAGATDDYDAQFADAEAPFRTQSCEYGVSNDCGPNEECVHIHKHSRSGICQCSTGWTRNELGVCIRSSEHFASAI